jgi:hypothetical protein
MPEPAQKMTRWAGRWEIRTARPSEARDERQKQLWNRIDGLARSLDLTIGAIQTPIVETKGYNC